MQGKQVSIEQASGSSSSSTYSTMDKVRESSANNCSSLPIIRLVLSKVITHRTQQSKVITNRTAVSCAHVDHR